MFRVLLIISAICLLGGCATFGGHTQRMKLATQPEGAKIIFNGKGYGQTPAFIDIPRDRQNSITFQRDGYPTVEKELTSSYRWGDSFFANFAWLLYGQPVASAIDLLTKTSWEYDRLGVIPLGTSLSSLSKSKPEIIAIAPPQGRFELLSDEVGQHLEKDAANHYPGSNVFKFAETRKVFDDYSYDHTQKPDQENMDNLYDHLKATHTLESDVQMQSNGVLVKTTLVDVYTDQRTPAFQEFIPAKNLQDSEATFKNFLSTLLGSVPNLLTFDLDTPSSNIQIQSEVGANSYVGVTNPSNNILQYISTLGIRSARPPKIVHGIKGVFRFAPALSFAYDQFQFDNTSLGGANTFSGYLFDWYTFFAGVGPEVGLDTNVGYFYLDAIPAYSINWITGTGNGQQASTRTTQLTFMAETGYEIFASSHVNIRLFFRSVGIPNEAFSNLMPALSGQLVQVNSVTKNVYGLSVGYYFPETRTLVKKLLF